jgi:sensor histidine kinase regulating citrate/malate metabolism
MIVRHADLSYSTDLIVLILLAQVVLLLNVFYVISLIGKKDMELVEAEERINELNRIMELTTKLKQLEHDMNTHVAIIGNLVHNRCYTELENYINSIFKDIKIASSICTLPDHAISMMINDLIMKASQKKILFERHLMIEEFYIESKDVCGIISNMVNNAIEATEKLEQERRYISLDIYPAKDGYYITCMNPYDTPVEYFHTTKKKKEEHGLGLGIIKMLTEKNGGVMQIIPNDYNWFEITSFIPVPQTEKSGAKEEKNSIL